MASAQRRLLIDGEPAAGVAADDRGLAYGDGVFRTVRVEGGTPVGWSAHLERLAHDCAALGLRMPAAAALAADCEALFDRQQDGVLKVIVSRGSGGRGYGPGAAPGRRIVSAHGLPPAGNGAPLVLEQSEIELAGQPRLAGIKHLNRLEQVLARAECERRGWAEAWMGDADARLVCATMGNLLFVDHRDRWVTPWLGRAGVIGACRERIRAGLAGEGKSLVERDLWIADLVDFNAALVCNSVRGPRPVARLSGQTFSASAAAAERARRLLLATAD